MAGYQYDLSASRFRDTATGRFVSDRDVRSALDAVTDAAKARVTATSQALLDGKLSLVDWQTQMMAAIKDAHLTAAMAAHGGRDMMSNADWGWTGQRIREQYDYLRNFAAEVANGQQPMDGRLTNRATLYSDAATSTYEAMQARDAKNSGQAMEERNVLGPVKTEHCSGCLAENARGWVPLGALVPVGQRSPCRSRCRCRLVRRKAVEVAA